MRKVIDTILNFLSINRNKRSLTLNFKEEKAREIFLKLAEDADVVVENFTPGVMDRFGLGYDTLKAVNPGIVFCSISGFGQTGPYRERPGFGSLVEAMSGFASRNGFISPESFTFVESAIILAIVAVSYTHLTLPTILLV